MEKKTAGKKVIVECSPKADYEFVEWSNGVKDNPYTFEMPYQDVELSAILKEKMEEYNIWYDGVQLTNKNLSAYSFRYYADKDSLIISGIEHESDGIIIRSTTGTTKLVFLSSNYLKTTGPIAIQMDGGSIQVDYELWIDSKSVAVDGPVELVGNGVITGNKSLSESKILIKKLAHQKMFLPKTFSVGNDKTVKFMVGNVLYAEPVNAWQIAAVQYLQFVSSSHEFMMWMPHINIDNVDWKDASFVNNDYQPVPDIRLLSIDEWEYLLRGRNNGLYLYGLGKIDSYRKSSGLIVLPDDWQLPEGCSFVAAATKSEPNFTDNQYTIAEWKKMEEAGALFLPCYGYTDENGILTDDVSGYYLSSDVADHKVNYLNFGVALGKGYASTSEKAPTTYNMCIRPVQDETVEGFDNIQTNSSAISVNKQIIDGQLYILRDGVYYNALGAKIK